MRFLRIAKLREHQHYKNRRPPWIKLHAKVLDDYRFTCLQDASKAHLMLLWVLASQMDNAIPYDLVWITRKLGAQSPIDVEELILQGFIEVFEDDSIPLAPRKQKPIPETERETEREKRKKPSADAGDVKQGSWLEPAHSVWEARFGAGTFKFPMAGRHLKPLRDAGVSPERIAAHLERYLDQTEPRFASLPRFAETFDAWKEPESIVDPVTGLLNERGARALGLA